MTETLQRTPPASAPARNPVLTVITPTGDVTGARHAWLVELAGTVTALGHLLGGPVEHLIAPDGPLDRARLDRLRAVADTFDTVRVLDLPGQSTHRGAAATRNLALLETTGRYVCSADDDDVIVPAGVARLVTALETDPDLVWACGHLVNAASDLTPTGRWEHPARPGRYNPGEVFTRWVDASGEFPLPPTALVVRREQLLVAGGWAGLPSAEDFGMVIAVTGTFAGRVFDVDAYMYRHHDLQATRTTLGDAELERAVRRWSYERGRLIGVTRSLSSGPVEAPFA